MNVVQRVLTNFFYENRRKWVWPNPFSINPLDVGPYVSWKFCEDFFGKDFKVQKVIFDTKLAPLKSYEFKRMFHDYIYNKSSDLFKCQWLLNDHFKNAGLNYPIQVNYHKWQFDDRWLINPGWLRYYIAHLDGQTEMPALYQPIFKTKLPVVEEYRTLEEMAGAHNIETSKTFISVTWFYKKPLMQISFNPDHPIRDKYDHVDYHERLYASYFEERIATGKIQYICSDKVKDRIRKELISMPDKIKSLVTFADDLYVTARVKLDDYSNDGFYCGLALFGTYLKQVSLPKIGLTYSSD